MWFFSRVLLTPISKGFTHWHKMQVLITNDRNWSQKCTAMYFVIRVCCKEVILHFFFYNFVLSCQQQQMSCFKCSLLSEGLCSKWNEWKLLCYKYMSRLRFRKSSRISLSYPTSWDITFWLRCKGIPFIFIIWRPTF